MAGVRRSGCRRDDPGFQILSHGSGTTVYSHPVETSLKPRTLQVRARTAHVMEHHYSTENPDKPLWLLVPGAMLALAALGGILALAYQIWSTKTLPVGRGVPWIIILSPVYVIGVFIFSYGYELYDLGAAIRLTLIVVVITALAVVMVMALFAVLGGLKGDSKSSGSSKSGGGSGGSSRQGSTFSWGRSNVWTGSGGSSPPPATSGPIGPIPPPMVPGPLPPALACPACGQSFFLGSRTLFCPACGGSIPPEILNAALPPRPPV